MFGCVFVLAVWNMALAQIILKRELKLWKIPQGTESRVATFHAEICVMFCQCVCVCVCVCVFLCVSARGRMFTKICFSDLSMVKCGSGRHLMCLGLMIYYNNKTNINSDTKKVGSLVSVI